VEKSLNEKTAFLLEEVRERLLRARRPLFMTGSGISAECGVPTFRGRGGLWREYRPEDLATPGAFRDDPWLVWQWYDWRRSLIAPVQPGRAHRAMAVCRAEPGGVPVITQNVDGLHQDAGSRDVLELHGSIWTLRCTGCGRERGDRAVGITRVPLCGCGALMRPGVVWFGEALPGDVLTRAMELSERADFVLVVGTSGVVQPAASPVERAREGGAYIVEVNPVATPLTVMAHASFRAGAGEVVPLALGNGAEEGEG